MKNYSIKNKVRFSFGVLAAFVIINAVLSVVFITSISGRIDDLYNHPFTVSSSLRDIENNTYKHYTAAYLYRILETDETAVYQTALNDIEEQHQVIMDDIQILKNNYLGDQEDITNVENAYMTVYNQTKQVLENIYQNEYGDANDTLIVINEESIPSFIENLVVMKDYASNKAIEFQEQANTIRNSYILIISFTSILMVVVAIVLFTLMIRDIFPAMQKLTNTIESYKKGEDINTLDLERGDEIGFIGQIFKEMLDSIKTQSEIDSLNLKLSNLQARENLRITLMSIGEAVISTDLKGDITNINQVALDLIDVSINEIINKNINECMNIIDKETREKIHNPISEVLKTQNNITIEKDLVLISNNGTEYEISYSTSLIQDEDGNNYGTVSVFRDVTDSKKAQREIEYISYHDNLTGLYNRNYLEKKFFELEGGKDKGIAVLMGDVNGLKITNDAFGHNFGDLLLKDISRILIESTPKDRSTIVRWGGDEFVIIIQDTYIQEIEEIIKKINVKANEWKSKSPVKPSISFGYSIKESANENMYRALIRAEDMMYENKLLRKDSLRSAIVQSLQTSLFEKSYETEEHATRVAKYSEQIAKALNLPGNEVNAVVLLSRLHDVGKIAIDDEVLSKPGKLSQKEWKEIRKHPETGYRIASSLNELTHIADGILCHHEFYDGNGYPRGIKGEEIPLHSRIVSIADAFDVMTSDRSYSKAMSTEKAIKELIRNKGTQFDPFLVDIFIKIIKK